MFEPETSSVGIADGGAYMGQIWLDNGYGLSIRLEPTNWTKGVPLYEVALIWGTPERWGMCSSTKLRPCDSDDCDCDCHDVIRYATGMDLLSFLGKAATLPRED
jgi:hypothetical protein